MKKILLNFIGISLATTTLISCASGSANENSGNSESYKEAKKKMHELIENDETLNLKPKHTLDLNGDGTKEEFIMVGPMEYALFTKEGGAWKQISSKNIAFGGFTMGPEILSSKTDGWNDFSIEAMVGVGNVYKWDGAGYSLSDETVETSNSDEGYAEEENETASTNVIVSSLIEGEWLETKTDTKISVSSSLEEGWKSYIWDETYDGAVESMVCIFSDECTDDRNAENDDNGTIIIIYNKDVVLCYKSEINKMDDGTVQLIMTDSKNNTVRKLVKK